MERPEGPPYFVDYVCFSDFGTAKVAESSVGAFPSLISSTKKPP